MQKIDVILNLFLKERLTFFFLSLPLSISHSASNTFWVSLRLQWKEADEWEVSWQNWRRQSCGQEEGLDEPGKVRCVTEDMGEWVAVLYWFRLEIEEEKGSDGVLLCKLSSQTLGAEYDEKTEGEGLLVPEKKSDPKPSHSLPLYFIILPFSVFIRNNLRTSCEENRKKLFFLLRLEINLFITVFEMETTTRFGKSWQDNYSKKVLSTAEKQKH